MVYISNQFYKLRIVYIHMWLIEVNDAEKEAE